MSDAASIRIVRLAPEQAKLAGAILARSHADYPSFRHLFPDAERRARVLPAVFSGVARDAARLGSTCTVLDGDAGLRGVAIWLAPEVPVESARAASRYRLDAVGAPRGSTFVSSVRTDGANSARLHPADPHWYLETMGVDPAVQRRGLGGRLLEPVLEMADRDQVAC